MSYVFSKALQGAPETKERRNTLPPTWSKPDVPHHKVAPPVATKPKSQGESNIVEDSALTSESGLAPASGEAKAPVSSIIQHHETAVQNAGGESDVMKALRKTSLPKRSYSVDSDDYNVGPKMGGAFARLQFQLEHGEDSKAGLYTDVYEAYKANKSLKEHGVLPTNKRDIMRKYSLDKEAPPVVLPKPRRPSAEGKRDIFAKSRSMTTPTSPTSNFFENSTEPSKVFHEKFETLPDVFEAEPTQTQVSSSGDIEEARISSENKPSDEIISKSEESIVVMEVNEKTVTQPIENPTEQKQVEESGQSKNMFGDPEHIKKLEETPEVIAMKQQIAEERTKRVEGQRHLSDAIDELENIDFGLEPVAETNKPQETPAETTISIEHEELKSPASSQKTENKAPVMEKPNDHPSSETKNLIGSSAAESESQSTSVESKNLAVSNESEILVAAAKPEPEIVAATIQTTHPVSSSQPDSSTTHLTLESVIAAEEAEGPVLSSEPDIAGASSPGVEPETPIALSEPEEHTGHTKSEAPIASAESEAPIASAESEAPIASAESEAPIASTESEAPIASAESEAPIASAESEAPIASAESEAPIASAESEAPIASTESEAPIASTESEAPIASAESEAPIASTESEVPIASTESEAPIVSAESEVPIASAESEAPIASTESEAPIASTESEAPIVSAESEVPIASAESEVPIASTESEAPIASAESEAPITSAESEAPIASAESEVPITSAESEAPIASAESEVPIAFTESEAPIASAESEAPIASRELETTTVPSVSAASIPSADVETLNVPEELTITTPVTLVQQEAQVEPADSEVPVSHKEQETAVTSSPNCIVEAEPEAPLVIAETEPPSIQSDCLACDIIDKQSEDKPTNSEGTSLTSNQNKEDGSLNKQIEEKVLDQNDNVTST